MFTQYNQTWHLIIILCIKSGRASQTNSYFWHEIASLAAYPDQSNRDWCQILVLLCDMLAQAYSSCSRKEKKKKKVLEYKCSHWAFLPASPWSFWNANTDQGCLGRLDFNSGQECGL